MSNNVSPYMAELIELIEQELNDALESLQHGQVELYTERPPFAMGALYDHKGLFLVLKNRILLPMSAAIYHGHTKPVFSVAYGNEAIKLSDHVSERLSFLMDGIVIGRRS